MNRGRQQRLHPGSVVACLVLIAVTTACPQAERWTSVRLHPRQTHEVRILPDDERRFTYEPRVVTVRRGDEVRWVNELRDVVSWEIDLKADGPTIDRRLTPGTAPNATTRVAFGARSGEHKYAITVVFQDSIITIDPKLRVQDD